MKSGALAVFVTFGSLLPGQVAPHSTDAARAVREVAEKIEGEMQEIDRLLRQARPPAAERQLADATRGQVAVIRGIDELLDRIHDFCPGGA